LVLSLGDLVRKEKLYDLTPKISQRLAVFPGDQPFERNVTMDMKQGAHLGLSWIRSTLHLGAHADAPGHYAADGVGIDQRPLDHYMGRAQVIRISSLHEGQRVGLKEVSQAPQAPRVLLDTGSFKDPETWSDTFCSFCPALLEAWAQQGVKLVGIDTPSVDPATSKDLPSHQMLRRYDLAVLEGLSLHHVPEGLYTLIALPLPIEGADASPVRAVLLADDHDIWSGR
jgi:arylformamidase